MGGRRSTVGCAAALVALLPTSALAQDATAGFGKRSTTVLSVENLIGKFDVTPSRGFALSEGWMGGPFVPHFGIFGMGASGLGGGVAFAFTHLTPDRGDGITLFDIRPRIAYAVSASPLLGAWLRAGPNLFYVNAKDGGSYAFGVGAEALAVLTPTPHFGVFGGLTFDVNVYGKEQDRDQTFTITGITVGVLADF